MFDLLLNSYRASSVSYSLCLSSVFTGAHSAPPDSLAGFEGGKDIAIGRIGEEKEGRKGKGKKERGSMRFFYCLLVLLILRMALPARGTLWVPVRT